MKPLLHLWSLAVEEQFYLAWPLVLVGAWWLGFRITWLVIGTLAVSFAVNVVLVMRGYPDAAFYSPASRFWELMIGAGLALMTVDLAPRFRDASSMLGTVLVVAAVTLEIDRATFPGLWALLPTVGTALLIAAGPASIMNRAVLAAPALVWVGLISYPLYLWHWPLLSIARIIEGQTPTALVRSIIVAISFGLAWATFRLVERPLRQAVPAHLTPMIATVGVLALVFAAGRGVYDRHWTSAPRVVVNEGEVVSEGGNDVFFERMASSFHPCEPAKIRDAALRHGDPMRAIQTCGSGATGDHRRQPLGGSVHRVGGATE